MTTKANVDEDSPIDSDDVDSFTIETVIVTGEVDSEAPGLIFASVYITTAFITIP